MIETERLILRHWRDEDRAPFAEMSADPQVMLHLDGPVGREASDAVIDRLAREGRERGHTFWAIEHKEDGAMLGFCGLRRGGHAGTAVPDELEIGWRLRREASLDWGWAHRDAPRIAAWTVTANAASWGLMERIGMVRRPELDFDHPRFAPGHPLCRHIVYAIGRPA